MQVFNTFFKIAKKHLVSCLVYLLVFTILLVMLTMSSSSEPATTAFEEASLNICIIDEDESIASAALTKYLTSIHQLVTLPSTDRETKQDSLYYGKIDYVLTIPSGFEKMLTKGNADGLIESSKRQDSADGYFVDQQINQYVRTLSIYLTGGSTMEEAIEKTTSSIDSTPEVTLLNATKTENANAVKCYQFFRYLPYILLSMLIVGMAPILIVFHKKDLKNRMQCSALSINKINIQLSLSCLIYSVIAWMILLVAAVFISGFEMVFSYNGILCILNSLVFLFVSVAITLCITLFSPNDNILNMIANVLGLGMSFLCGIFVPQYLLSDTVISISRFLPVYWYVRINNMLSGASGERFSMENYLMWIGIEFLFCIALFALYLVGSKQKRMEQKK